MIETGNLPPQEAQQEDSKKVEVIHLDQYDLMVNRSSNPELVEAVVQNLREDTERVIGKQSEESDIFVKKRRFASPSSVREVVNTPDNEGRNRFGGRKTQYAFNSLMNEFGVVQKVKEVMRSDEIKEIAKKYGLVDIRFAEPLIGIIDKKSGDKFMIYPRVKDGWSTDGLSLDELDRRLGFNIYSLLTGLLADLRQVLIQNNINPYDLSGRQFIVSETPEGRVLHLLDVEAFTIRQSS